MKAPAALAPSMNQTNLVCIVCPLGCALTATPPSGETPWQVTGNRCVRGLEYAIEELTTPRRVLTTTVTAVGGELRRLPVKTARPIPKELLLMAAAHLAAVKVAAPVHLGEVIVPDLLGTGVPVVATRDLTSAGGEKEC